MDLQFDLGIVAQLEERLLHTQEVIGSRPVGPIYFPAFNEVDFDMRLCGDRFGSGEEHFKSNLRRPREATLSGAPEPGRRWLAEA